LWDFTTPSRPNNPRKKRWCFRCTRLTFFYIDNGGVGLETQLQPGIDEMMTALKQKGYKEGRDYFYTIDTGAKHFESDWSKRFPKAVSICLEH
jgi:hypothetical protein